MDEYPKSQLPRDPEYWEELARGILEDASGPLAAYAASQEAWHDVLARRAAWVVGSSVAAMFLLWFVLPAPDSSLAFRWIEHSLAPDEIAGSMLSGPAPPSLDDLMVQFPPAIYEKEER